MIPVYKLKQGVGVGFVLLTIGLLTAHSFNSRGQNPLPLNFEDTTPVKIYRKEIRKSSKELKTPTSYYMIKMNEKGETDTVMMFNKN